MSSDLSHLDSQHRPTMVDVSHKSITLREATAKALVTFPSHIDIFKDGSEFHTSKGPVIATAIIAGTMAVKKTSDLIPFCHAITIDSCRFHVEALNASTLEIACTVKTHGVTGVEMEAIVGVSLAAATIYDMGKCLTHDIVIGPIQLISKRGGKSDFTHASLS